MIKKFLFFLSSKQKTYLSIVFFLILIYSLFEVINLGLVLPIFEYYISGDTNLINKLIFNEKLNKYIDKYYFFPMFIFIILIILKNFFYLILFWFQNEFNFNVQISITNRVFKKYIEQNYTDFIKRNSSEYLKNIITETPVIGQSVCNLSLILLTEIMVSIGIFIVILTYNFKVSLILIVVISLTGSIYFFKVKNALYKMGSKRYSSDTKRVKILKEGFQAIKEIKILNKENFFIDQFSIYNRESAKMNKFFNFFQILPRFIFEMLAVTMLFLVIFFFSENNFVKIIPTLIFFFLAFLRLMPSVMRIISSLQGIKFGLKSLDIIYNDLIQKKEEIKNQHININLKFKNSLKLSQVSHKFKGKDFLFENLNFEIYNSEKIGILGESGSGKSTLLNILTGIIKPDNGKVLCDKEDIFLNIKSWQKNIAYVQQDPFVFDDTIVRNITFEVDQAKVNKENLFEALEQANLNNFVKKLPLKENTIIGEEGTSISGGEKQRIALARSLYLRKKIIFLDEPTSSLDEVNEKKIIDILLSLKNTTIVMVTHKKDNILKFDKVINLDKKN